MPASISLCTEGSEQPAVSELQTAVEEGAGVRVLRSKDQMSLKNSPCACPPKT